MIMRRIAGAAVHSVWNECYDVCRRQRHQIDHEGYNRSNGVMGRVAAVDDDHGSTEQHLVYESAVSLHFEYLVSSRAYG